MAKKLLISGAEYWDFTQQPKFVGSFVSEHKDDKGKIIGFDFLDEQQEPWIVTNSFSIQKALEMISFSSEVLMEIVFKGKITVKSTGKPFNKYEVSVFEPDEPSKPEKPKK